MHTTYVAGRLASVARSKYLEGSASFRHHALSCLTVITAVAQQSPFSHDPCNLCQWVLLARRVQGTLRVVASNVLRCHRPSTHQTKIVSFSRGNTGQRSSILSLRVVGLTLLLSQRVWVVQFAAAHQQPDRHDRNSGIIALHQPARSSQADQHQSPLRAIVVTAAV